MLVFNKLPNFWDEKCNESNNYFQHSQWHSILNKGFNTETIFLWDETKSCGLSITIFKKAIFKIGYLGFPIGSTLSGANIDDHFLSSVKSLVSSKSIQILRIPSGNHFPTSITIAQGATCPETYIPDLKKWSFESLSKHCRRDVKKAIRENTEVEQVVNPLHSIDLYNLYKDTIRKNSGSVRYNEKYFEAVIQASINNKAIHCTCIKNNDEIIAFAIVVLSESIAHYLHGAINYNYRKSLPNDLLIYDAIKWAKDNNAKVFNLMSSPEMQHNLIKYKEKWGGHTSPNITFEYSFSTIYSTIFNITNSSFQIANKFISRFK